MLPLAAPLSAWHSRPSRGTCIWAATVRTGLRYGGTWYVTVVTSPGQAALPAPPVSTTVSSIYRHARGLCTYTVPGTYVSAQSGTSSRATSCPELEARGGRPAPCPRAARPGLAVAPEPARHLRVDPRAHALHPGGPIGAPDPRVSVRARNYLSRARTRLMQSKALISTAPSPSTST